MAKEYWYFIAGVLAVVLPLLVVVAVKKLNLLDVRPDQTIVYAEHQGKELVLHRFKAQGVQGSAPALLLFHGGGWLYGEPRHLYPQCQFFSRQGFECFSAQYRLGSNAWPEIRGGMEDARAALDYLFEHANELGIDPARIAVGGGSAGGQLAAAVGTGLPTSHDNAARPTALVLYNPVLDFAPGTPHHYLAPDYWREISPRQHIDHKVPPTLIMTGSRDLEVPVSVIEDFCTAVTTAGGRCEAEIYEGLSHGFFHTPKHLDATNQRILTFLESLDQSPATR